MRFDEGDFGVTVQWYERVPSDSSRLEFTIGERQVYAVNSTELRHWLPFDSIKRIEGLATFVSRPTRGTSRAPAAARQAENDKNFGKKVRKYRVSSAVEQIVVDRCWQCR